MRGFSAQVLGLCPWRRPLMSNQSLLKRHCCSVMLKSTSSISRVSNKGLAFHRKLCGNAVLVYLTLVHDERPLLQTRDDRTFHQMFSVCAVKLSGSEQAEISPQQLHLSVTSESAVQQLGDGYSSSSCTSTGNANPGPKLLGMRLVA
jgi:hypothetical protein